ncbi:MAG: 16S rRNA (uracil(1498)-N(3))-methyltransferase [Desulfobacteraceae bacterium 4572_130]|nr:MAG: 16S rRNA (uracil(1498)-N(3))-methyltransferase [Desulfobacteraceae bacterium 4572_130]
MCISNNDILKNMRRFYVNKKDINHNKAIIKGQDAIHLALVLRLVPGNIVELVDGENTNYKAEIINISPFEIKLLILNKKLSMVESPVHISIAQAMLKNKKMDILIRYLTELGITEWIPFFSQRSIPKHCPKRIKSRIIRWEKIAKQALKQCKRSNLPIINKPVQFNEIINISKTYDTKIAFWEKSSLSINTIKKQNKNNKIFVLIGPEGGFTDNEMQFAKNNGFNVFFLGPRILRAETACIAGCTLIQNIFGDLG